MGMLLPTGKATVSYLVFVSACWCTGYAQTIAQVNSLSTALFTNYNKHTRPVNDQTQNLTVHISMSLIALRDFDEVLGKFSTALLLSMSWKDESLVWDPSMYNNIESIKASQDSVWKPLLTLTNPYSKIEEMGDRNWVTVTVHNEGEVAWDPFVTFDTSCSINTKYYPFDTQTCKVEMFTFGYSQGEVTMNPLSSTLGLVYYEGHATWELVSSEIANIQRGSGVSAVTLLTLTMKFERLHAFIIVNFLIPILVLVMLNPLVFLLPTDSGERISFAITILLSLSVFMTILADYIPKNADPVSLCANMLMILYVCSASIVVVVTVSIKIHFISDARPVNACFRAFVRVCSLQFFTCRKNRAVPSDNQVVAIEKNAGSRELKNATKHELGKYNMEEAATEAITWKDVGRAIDHCCFVLVYITITLVIAIYLHNLKSGE